MDDEGFARRQHIGGAAQDRKTVAVAKPSGLAAPALFVAMDAFAPLVALLRFKTKRSDRPSIQARDPYGFARLFTIAVRTVFDAAQSFVNLRNQLALTVSCSEFERPISL